MRTKAAKSFPCCGKGRLISRTRRQLFLCGYPVSDDGHMENPERLAARLTVVSREAPVTDQPSGEDVSSDGEPDKGDPEKSDTTLRWILIAAACAVIAAAGGTAVLLVKKKRKKASEDMGQDPEKPQDGKK